MKRIALNVFLITASTIVLCAVIPVVLWLLYVLVIAQGTLPDAQWQNFVQEVIALFTTVEGFAFLCEMFCPIAFISLYVSVPLSAIIVAIYCFVQWRRKKREPRIVRS